VRRGIALGVVAMVTIGLVSTTASLRAERDRWGDTVEVAVVAERRDVGDPVSDGQVNFALLPVGAVPDDAVGREESFAGNASVPLHPGDVLRRRDLAGTGALQVPDGQRAIAIPIGADVPGFRVGDRVEVFVFEDAFNPVVTSAADAVAGRVIQLSEDAVVIAVDVARTHEVAAGVVNGTVILAAA